MVFKHRTWVGVLLTWEPVGLNNLQYFMYNYNNTTDFKLLSQNPLFFLANFKKATDLQIISYWHLLNFSQHLTAENYKRHFQLPAGAATGYW